MIEDPNLDTSPAENTYAMPTTKGLVHYELEGGEGPARLFRPDRWTPHTLGLERVRVTARGHDGTTLFENAVLDVGPGGLAFHQPTGHGLEPGDELPLIELCFHDLVVYTGAARVIHTLDDEALVGLHFTDGYLTGIPEQAHQAATRAGLEAELIRLESSLQENVDPRIKVVTADLERLLSSLQAMLSKATPPRASEEAEIALARLVEPRTAPLFHALVARLFELNHAIPREQHEPIKRYMHARLRQLLLPAPLYARALHKPLGYAGDYMTMSIVYDEHFQGPSAYAKLINRFCCDVTIAHAVSARRDFLMGWIQRVIAEQPRPRVLSIASGPAREVQDLIETADPELALDITLLDQDREALAFAQGRIAPLLLDAHSEVQVSYVQGGVKSLVKEPQRFSSLHGQHLIYSAGLFDYLPTRAAQALMTRLYSLLAPGGRLVIGNLAPTCDTQGFFEFLVDWDLIYRTDEELMALAQHLGAVSMHVEAEATGVNRFLVLERGS